MPTNWEEAAREDAVKYIACVPDGLPYDASGLIDAGNLLAAIREQLGYKFIGQNVLEFGCGNGRMMRFLRPYFGGYCAVDISETMLEKCADNMESQKTAIFVKSDGKDIEIVDNSVDLIFTFTVLMHNKKADVPLIIKEFQRILKPGGYFFFQLPCYRSICDIQKFNDVAIWNKQEVESLAAGFEIVKIEEAPEAMGARISDKHFKYHVFKKL